MVCEGREVEQKFRAHNGEATALGHTRAAIPPTNPQKRSEGAPATRSPPDARPTPARRPPDTRPTPARRPPDARPTPARRPPDARPTPSRRPPDAPPDAPPTPARRPPDARPTPARRPPDALPTPARRSPRRPPDARPTPIRLPQTLSSRITPKGLEETQMEALETLGERILLLKRNDVIETEDHLLQAQDASLCTQETCTFHDR
ncbi:alpha carbonic anhydrase 8-like [Penaeus chinensis]|uniref:alpha carbonic anhydrase 8-like n=1 Tax=Penaeus chinensis TaxID=139456 RepID=UPI001FB78057|nr:alpha carbonic anhydrase 8-like [Penaeus chinensis]